MEKEEDKFSEEKEPEGEKEDNGSS